MTGMDVFNFLNNMAFSANLLVSFIDEDGALIGDIYCRWLGGIEISSGLYCVWRKSVRCLDFGMRNGCATVRFIVLKGEENDV